MRATAYAMLHDIAQACDLDSAYATPPAFRLLLPQYHASFVTSLCENLSGSASALTLDLLIESFRAAEALPIPQAMSLVLALRPWYANIASIAAVASQDALDHLDKLREISRRLIRLGRDERVRRCLASDVL